MKELSEKIFYILPKGDPVKVLLLFFLMMVAAVLEVAGIGMIPAFVAIVADPDRVLNFEPLQKIYSYFEISTSEDLLLYGSVILVAIFVIKSLYIVTFNYFEAKFIYNRRYTIGLRLMSSYMQAPYTFHLKRNSAELLRNITQEVNVVINIVVTKLLNMAREGVMTLAILLLLFMVEPLITFIVLSLSGVGAGSFLLLTQKKVKRYGIEQQGYRTTMIKYVNQGFGGIKDARVLNRENEFIDQFRSELYKSSKLLAYIRYIQQIPKPVVETTAVLGMMLISGLMVWQGRPMATIIPILTLFAMAMVRLMPSVQQLSSMYTDLKYNLVSINPVFDDLKELDEYRGKFLIDRAKNEVLTLQDKIEVNNVFYSYPETDEQALKGISFTIPKGGAVAFVGESGAGKTTIVDLLLGLLEPVSGNISVDGNDIHESLSAWQRNIGYIPQSIYLGDESLRRNIAFGIPEDEIDDKKVLKAVKLAQLNSMVERLPDKLETIVGEHGTRLSGGQRQRVGIARALYHDPEVLVMDEATSALDNITEKQITKAIEALKGERTIIMIAHRLTTVQNCDLLYLMNDGEIVDSGGFDDLISKNSDFRKMALVD